MSLSKSVCEMLLQIKAIKLSPQNPFTWASGIQSPIYCDNRISLSHVAGRSLIQDGLVKLASQYSKLDAIAGVATAGIAHGALLADRLSLPFAYVRSEAKSHGRKNKIEGDLPLGSKVLVVEDLISTGGSSIQVVEILREEGIEVLGVIAIFDYGFSLAKNNFSTKGINYATITNYPELLNVAVENKYITSDELDTLTTWSSDPEAWQPNNNDKT